MRCRLHQEGEVKVAPADIETFASETDLSSFASTCDVIVHLAGMNRGDDEELYRVNVGLAKSLIEACKKTDSKPHILFASSVHISRDTAYARSKRKCAEIFDEWAKLTGGKFTNVILPNVFGEHGKPFYNSMVATFCFQLAEGEEPKIIEDSRVELVHAQDVAQTFVELIHGSEGNEYRLAGQEMWVHEVIDKLKQLDAEYRNHVIPNLKRPMDLNLFNTYRSFLYPKMYPVSADLREDERGVLFEAVKSRQGGQCFISTTKPGVTRGNHYHRRKFERFMVIGGQGVIRIRRLLTDTVDEFPVSGDAPRFVDIPTLHTHNLTNTSRDDLITLFWAHEIFDADQPDTYPEQV